MGTYLYPPEMLVIPPVSTSPGDGAYGSQFIFPVLWVADEPSLPFMVVLTTNSYGANGL